MRKAIYLFLTVLIVACSGDGGSDEGNPCDYNPTLTTSAVANVTETSATLNGVISIVSENCDNPTNTEQGFVYATTIQPTINNIQVNVNGTTITTTLENLEPNTTYYARAFLTNALGEFYGNEVNFTTETSTPTDTTAPVITLNGEAIVTVIENTTYVDAGATAIDNIDGDLTSSIVTTGEVNTSVIGSYTITYTVSDSAGNTATATRQVTVEGNGNPVYLDSNGVTIKAREWAVVGDIGVINGVTYTVVDEAMLRSMLPLGDLTKVVTTKVTNMFELFFLQFNSSFNQDISSWDVSNVTDMGRMFYGANSFNQPIGDWDVSSVTNIRFMFGGAEQFKQDISNWDVSRLTDMEGMFFNARRFNQPIGNWDVSNVTNMRGMFWYASAFNQPIGDWNVSNVTDMIQMFAFARDFNQPIGDWDVSNVEDMYEMFFSFTGVSSTVFNQDISNWDVSNVEDMERMFFRAQSFNQNLSGWNVNNVTGCIDFSYSANSWTLPQPNFTNCTP